MIRGLTYLLMIMLVTGCASRSQSEAEKRLRGYFRLSDSTDLESKPSPLLTEVPIGTPEGEVYSFLEQAGIGKDGLSSYHRAEQTETIVCRVEHGVNSPGLVKESFGIFFDLDKERKVENIRIQRWLTGP